MNTLHNNSIDKYTSSHPLFHFMTLSPRRAEQWDQTNNSQRQKNLHLKLEEDIHTMDALSSNESICDSDEKLQGDRKDGDMVSNGELNLSLKEDDKNWSSNVNWKERNDKKMNMDNDDETALLGDKNSSEASSLPSYAKSSDHSKPFQNWANIDTLIDNKLQEIDNHDFGNDLSLHLHLGLDETRQNHSKQQNNHHKNQPNDNITHTVVPKIRDANKRTQKGKTLDVTKSISLSAHSMPSFSASQSTHHISPIDRMANVVVLEQPYSFNHILSKDTLELMVDKPFPRSKIDCANPLDDFPIPDSSATKESSNSITNSWKFSSSDESLDLRAKLRSLEHKMKQLSSDNLDLQHRVQSYHERIDQLEVSEEEARQEAALWEARWRDDFVASSGESSDATRQLIIEDLRGALLQKSKTESESIKAELRNIRAQLQEKTESSKEEIDKLTAENEKLRAEVSCLTNKVMASSANIISPSKMVQSISSSHSDTLTRLDRMAKTSRESEQKWSARVSAAEVLVNQLRRDLQMVESQSMKMADELEAAKQRADVSEQQTAEMKLELVRSKDDISRLHDEKKVLLDELEIQRHSLEKSRNNYEATKLDIEQKLEKEKEKHRHEMDRVMRQVEAELSTEKASTLQQSKRDSEATFAKLTQEKLILQEENASLSDENEKWAKRCVELERAINGANSNIKKIRTSLQIAESNISDLKTEKRKLEESLHEMNDKLAAVTAEYQIALNNLDESTEEKESMHQRLSEMQNKINEANAQLQTLNGENEMIKLKEASLVQNQVKLQDELQSLQCLKEKVDMKIVELTEANTSLRTINLSMKERLSERHTLLETIRQRESESPLIEENRILRSSLTGLEHQLRCLETALLTEKETIAATEHAREQAENKIGELENQIKSLRNDASSLYFTKMSEKNEKNRVLHELSEMKSTISSLREEISSAAIARSHLELEMRQRDDECAALKMQLDPLQKEKYRLEMDNSALSDEIKSLKEHLYLSGCGIKECNHGCTQKVERKQEKQSATDNTQHAKPQLHNNEDTTALSLECNLFDRMLQTDDKCKSADANKFKSSKSDVPKISRRMLEQLDRARAAAKETALIIKSQRANLSADVSDCPPSVSNLQQSDLHPANSFSVGVNTQELLSGNNRYIDCGTNVSNQSEALSLNSQSMPVSAMKLTPTAILTALNTQFDSICKHPHLIVDKRVTPTAINERTRMEEEHQSETRALKKKYQERIRCMKNQWESEKKAILGLVANVPNYNPVKLKDANHIVETPVNVTIGDEHFPLTLHGNTYTFKKRKDSICDTVSDDTSFLEAETFVLNILNELDSEMD